MDEGKTVWIVVSGNLADGFYFYGSWETPEDAVDWAEGETWNEDWSVVKMEVEHAVG